jgi:hypothetical protein
MDTQEQVYIPANISRICDIEVGMIYSAVLVPNNHQSGDKIPWLAVRVDPDEAEPTDEDLEAVKRELCGVDFPLQSEHVDASTRALREAWRRGMIVKIEARESPDSPVHVFWAASLDHV